jgi:antitoxin component of MazEF toxin-antitoxin module
LTLAVDRLGIHGGRTLREKRQVRIEIMASRSIAVRIKTEKVIASLEASLEKMRKEKESEKARKEKYDKDLEAWQSTVKKVALDMPKPKDMDRVVVGHRYGGNNNRPYDVQFVVEVPADKVPPRPVEPQSMSDWEYREAVEHIENALRLLRMTDQEEVSTGTYNKIAKYL